MSQRIASIITASLRGVTDSRGAIRWGLLREVAFSPDRLSVLLWQVCLYLVFFVFPFLRTGTGLDMTSLVRPQAPRDLGVAGRGSAAPATARPSLTAARPRPGRTGRPAAAAAGVMAPAC